MTELSPHFAWQEATYSSGHPGIPNVPDDAERDRIQYTARRMESIRHLLGDNPTPVHSWFRGANVR